MDSLKIAKKQAENELHIFFIGSIDENSELPDLTKDDTPKLVFDFRKVTYLNSIGIAKWVTWINQLISAIPKTIVVFQNCPQIFVNQINTIKDFLPDTVSVSSFDVPFYCEECNYSSMVTYEQGKEYIASADKDPQFQHPEPDCMKCQQPMELDVVEAKYFAFLKKKS